MLSFRAGAVGSKFGADAMAGYLTDHQVRAPVMATYYVAQSGTVRADLDPKVAAMLGADTTRPVTKGELSNILSGRRTDGTEIIGSARQGPTKDKARIAYYDLTFAAPKHLSVAIALAPTDRERAVLDKCHTDAVAEALVYIETQIKARKGHAGRDGSEGARMAWWTFEDYTARPVAKIADGDATILVATHIHGDPHRHTHCIVPTATLTESGRVSSLHGRKTFAGRVLEYGAIYQAFLATKLRAVGVDARLDLGRTDMAYLPEVPKWAADHFSKRSMEAEEAARQWTAGQGEDWDSLTPRSKIERLRKAAADTRAHKPDGDTDFDIWKREAAEAGYAHRSVVHPEQAAALAPRPERLARAYSASLPAMEPHLERRSKFEGAIARVAAAKGLIAAGIEDPGRDIYAITRAMRTEGVRQDGTDTALVWGREPGAEFSAFTTMLHLGQEREAIGLLKAAAADRSAALPMEEIDRAIAKAGERHGLDFNSVHGRAQLDMLRKLGTGGRAGIGVGIAGSGKGAIISVLGDAWHAVGRETVGVTVAWRQTDALVASGIGTKRLCRVPDTQHFADAGIARAHALAPFLSGVARGVIKVDANTVVVVDEIAQVGTRQILQLARLQAQHGFQFVGLGDGRQCHAQPLEAKVLTPVGWRSMGDLKAGDKVITPAGEHTSITKIWPQGQKDIYRLTFSDGRQTECCADHLWKIWDERSYYSPGSHATRTLLTGQEKWKILPLRAIKKWFDNGYTRTQSAAIPLPGPFVLERPSHPGLPIPPYALGLLLGDGHFAHGIVHYSTADPFLLEQLTAELPEYEIIHVSAYDHRLRVRNPHLHQKGRIRTVASVVMADYARGDDGRKPVLLSYGGRSQSLRLWARERGISHITVRTRIGGLGWSVAEALGFEPHTRKKCVYSPLSIAIADLGLTGTRSFDKFIPDIYKTGSIAQRLDVIRGLLDTDGTVGQGGTYAVYGTNSLRMARDVQDVVRSLGGIASIGVRPAGRYGREKLLTHYYMNIKHPDISSFFRLPRKVAQTKPHSKRMRLRLKSIEHVGIKQVQCLTVEDAQQLYITDDYIVTHNSIDAGDAIRLMEKAIGDGQIPELVSTVRQTRVRDRETALLFRSGQAAEALERKTQDGTLHIVPGGHSEAVGAAVKLWQERTAVNAGVVGFTIGISAPTNADARAIGAEIRRVRQTAGEVKSDAYILDAVDQTGVQYELPVAVGDRVRLFNRVYGVHSTGRTARVGDNGSVVTIVSVGDDGLVVRNARDRVAKVAWAQVVDRETGRIRLSYGDALTIDSRQGDTVSEHITVMPYGSRALDGFKAYTAESRHRSIAWMVTSQGEEMAEIERLRPLGDPRNDITAKAKVRGYIVEHMAKNLSRQPEKTLATDFVERASNVQHGAVSAHRASWHQEDKPARSRPPRVTALREAAAVVATVDAVKTQRAAIMQSVQISEAEVVAQFAAALEGAGLRLKGPPVMDGQLQRNIPVEGGGKKGSYVGHLDGRPAGYIRNFKQGTEERWSLDVPVRPMSLTERTAFQHRVAAEQVKRDAERTARHEKVAGIAQRIWDKARPVVSHDYLKEKSVAAHNLRQDRAGRLLVPMRDIDGKLWNLQTIWKREDGSTLKLFGVLGERNEDGKRERLGGRTQGLFTMLGHPGAGEPVVIAEGFATAATVRELARVPIAVAFSAGNLRAVAEALRAKEPDRPLIIAADNDHHLERRSPPMPNTGVVKAREAAEAVGGKVVMPRFDPSDRGTDWNDKALRDVATARQELAEAGLVARRGLRI